MSLKTKLNICLYGMYVSLILSNVFAWMVGIAFGAFITSTLMVLVFAVGSSFYTNKLLGNNPVENNVNVAEVKKWFSNSNDKN